MHSIVFANEQMFAGWPANHGAWQWGDEFLVGFMSGQYSSRGSMHRIKEPFTRMLARSLDGGATWSLEAPPSNFEATCYQAAEAPPLDIASGAAIIRGCGVYDTGGDYTHPAGGFYASVDRGRTWSGMYPFTGVRIDLSLDHITARTCVLRDLVFISVARQDQWGTDSVAVLRHDGHRFRMVGQIQDVGRVVMPAAAQVDDRIVAVARRRKGGARDGWIDAYDSDDDGVSWNLLCRVGDTGSHNGNPPALAYSGGRLFCAYANRSECAMYCSVSDDGGESWKQHLIRRGSVSDIGYPRMLVRSDGVPVVVYYWADGERKQQHIAASSLEQLVA